MRVMMYRTCGMPLMHGPSRRVSHARCDRQADASYRSSPSHLVENRAGIPRCASGVHPRGDRMRGGSGERGPKRAWLWGNRAHKGGTATDNRKRASADDVGAVELRRPGSLKAYRAAPLDRYSFSARRMLSRMASALSLSSPMTIISLNRSAGRGPSPGPPARCKRLRYSSMG